ncbi:MAG: hypothetical protein LBS81_04875 [Endomicrobium sp.]|nr:hypothetical protein [Endomicrobium sp.]
MFLFGCGENNNIFSWFHVPGTGSYDSLMSDGVSAMGNKNYSKAAQYYKEAINTKHGDKDAVMGYASASIAEALGSNITEIISEIVEKNNTDNLLNKISQSTIDKLENALNELINDKRMFPALFGPTPPTDTNTNLNAALVYALFGVVTVVNAVGFDTIIGDFSLSSTFPDYSLADQKIRDAVNTLAEQLNESDLYIQRIMISDGGEIATSLHNEFNKLKKDLQSKGYPLI